MGGRGFTTDFEGVSNGEMGHGVFFLKPKFCIGVARCCSTPRNGARENLGEPLAICPVQVYPSSRSDVLLVRAHPVDRSACAARIKGPTRWLRSFAHRHLIGSGCLVGLLMRSAKWENSAAEGQLRGGKVLVFQSMSSMMRGQRVLVCSVHEMVPE